MAAFSTIYDQYRDLLSKDTLLVAEGGLSIDDYTKSLRLTAEKLYSMEQARELFARNITLNLETPDNPQLLERLADILQPFRGGQCPIVIHYRNHNAKAALQLGDDWRIHPSDELLNRLRRLLTVEAVEVRYR